MSVIGTQEEKFYVKELLSVNELIEKFSNIFEIQRGNIQTLAPELVELQKEFQPKYLNFINIKRFAIPIIGRISSGKSTFLNFLLGLKNILETSTDIATKFVCIIRFNQLINKPKAYSVILEERKQKNSKIENGFSNDIPKFNFEKGEELDGDIQKIISDRNKYISEKNGVELKKEDFFMIIETNFPIFNKEMIKYSEIFEFMDLPGLNEQEGEKDFFRKNILPIIASNTKFAIFIFDCLSVKDKDTIEIYENFENLLKEKIENSFYILNKIDKATNDKEVEINNFKNYIHERYDVDINKNHFLGTNALLLLKESEKYNNFFSYLVYKITESNDGNNKSFIVYVKKEMEKDLNIKQPIKLNDYQIPPINGSDDNLNDIIKELNKQLENKNFGKLLDLDNYLKLNDIFTNNNLKGKNNLEVGKEIYNKLFSSIKNVTDSFMNLSSYDKSLHLLMNKITKNNSNEDFYEIIEKLKYMNDFHYSTEKLNNLKNIIDKLGELEPDNNFIQKIIQGYEDLLEFINKDRKIRIAVLGLYSSGKSTILNCIIGQKILPTNSSECTRRGIIIRYHNKDEPELYQTKFIEKLDYYTFEDSQTPLCTGFQEVKNKLKELNNTNCTFEDSFLILKINIKSFDTFSINNELKEKIELIDFPGLNTENNFYEEKIFGPLMKFTDGYIFLNKDDLIKEKSNVTILKEIINRIESRKFKFDFKSFLFVLNQHSNKELNIKKAKNDLDEIILNKTYEKSNFWNILFWKKKEKINDELNVTCFNAKLFEQFLDFREKLKNFKTFIEECIEGMDEETNLYKYINENCYHSKFKDTKLDSIDHETTILFNSLSNILQEHNIKIDKNTCYFICQTYQAMKKNWEKDERFIKSNAHTFFGSLIKQINDAKKNLDENFKFIYINYVKNLVYSFELINLNLLGNNICREISIEKIKNQIQKTYEKYHLIILKKEDESKILSLKKIDEYIKNYDSYNHPKQKANEIAEEITKLIDEHFKDIRSTIDEFKKELEKIKSDLKENIRIYNQSLNFNDSIYKNFFSKKHLISHVGIAAAESFGAGLFYAGSVLTGPVGLTVAIGIHFIMALGFYFYDSSEKKTTLIKNMNELKKNINIKFEGNKEKIETIILKIKKEIDNSIETIVDSQNSEFNGIKSHKQEYNKIYSEFKKLYISNDNQN